MEKQMMDTINNLIKNGNEITIKIYNIALQQQKIKQVIWGISSFISLCLLILGIWYIINGLRKEKNGESPYEYEPDYAKGILIGGFSLILFLFFFYYFLTFTFNPQYAALKDIVDMLLKK